MNPLLSVKEVAKYLGVSPTTVFRYKDNKALPFYKDNSSLRSRLRFKQEEIDEWLNHYKKKNFPVDNIIQNALTNPPPVIIDRTEGGQGAMAKAKTKRLTFVFNGEVIPGTIYQRETNKGNPNS